MSDDREQRSENDQLTSSESTSLLAGRLGSGIFQLMQAYTAVVEKCPETGLFVGFIPGFPGAHTQGASLDELQENLREVVSMLLEDGEPSLEAEFVGTQTVAV